MFRNDIRPADGEEAAAPGTCGGRWEWTVAPLGRVRIVEESRCLGGCCCCCCLAETTIAEDSSAVVAMLNSFMVYSQWLLFCCCFFIYKEQKNDVGYR